MKKTILSLALLTAGFTMSAQESALQTFVLEDFESGAVTFTETVNINPSVEMVAEVVANPKKDDVNSSDKVWKWTREEVDNVWAGFWAVLTNEVPKGYQRIEIKYYREDAKSQLKIKCEGASNVEFLPMNAPEKTGEWEVLTFDLLANNVYNVRVLGMQVDFRDAVEDLVAGTVTYVDDITFIYDESLVPEEEEILTLFHDSSDDTFHDQSWSPKATAPSTLALVGGGEDKMPVVTSPVKDGNNALKLQWKSAEGGDWSVMVSSIGWVLHDLTSMDVVKMYIYSETGIAKSALPNVHFEAGSGNPNTTGKVAMGNYLTTDVAATTWTEVVIPLADIWAANAEFTAKDAIKGLYFSQNTADNTEHTLYVDEITFEKADDTAIGEVQINAKNVNYNNGLLTINDYEGMVEVFNITGQKVFTAEMANSAVACQLQQGIYVVRYAQGASKLIVR